MPFAAGQIPTAAELDAIEGSAPHADEQTGVTLDASAYATITHGAGFTPTAVTVQPSAPISGASAFGQVIVDSITATTFRIRCYSPTGVGLNSGTVSFFYACFP